MAAPRATQFIALRRLAAPGHQVRHLHMTGPATYASNVLSMERPVTNVPRDIAGLRAECKRRKLDFSGSKQDVSYTLSTSRYIPECAAYQRWQLLSRLNADELTHSRAFSTAVEQSKRPVVDKTEVKPVRHFNTSRTLKAVNDSSTIDFAFLPDFDPDNADAVQIRVPLLPTNFFPPRNGAHAPEADDAVSIA